MSQVMNNVAKLFTGQIEMPEAPAKPKPTPQYSERDLLRMESSIGRELFGPVPKDRQREFFCLDNRTWIWYEHWTDPQTQQPKELTTRYEIHSNGIVKIQEGQAYKVLEGEELKNLESAVKIYHQRVMSDVYGHHSENAAEPRAMTLATA